ncbi:hypothetical protein B0H10DRAFT_2441787 [Mycena sp. CBHHK59/15]|nr:hypothetical protein B0H10DRAFT_2441787 [Mycena sp. CBHHK59/15]
MAQTSDPDLETPATNRAESVTTSSDLQYERLVFAALRDPFHTPYCYATYVSVIHNFQMALETTSFRARFLDLVESLVSFHAVPVDDDSSYNELEDRLLKQPCKCHTATRELHADDRAGEMPHLGLEKFLAFLANTTCFALSVCQTEKGVHQLEFSWKVTQIVESHASRLAPSFTHWLRRSDSLWHLPLFGNMLELSPALMVEFEASDLLRAVFTDQLHLLVASDVDLGLILRGAGGFARQILRQFCCYAAPGPAKAAGDKRFRACFAASARGLSNDLCAVLSLLATNDRDAATRDDAGRLAYLAQSLNSLDAAPDAPSPLIALAIADLTPPPLGWQLFQAHIEMSNRCSNTARHSPNVQDQIVFHLTFKARVKRPARMLACARCRVSNYCSKECQRENWATMHRYICPILQKILHVHKAVGRSSHDWWDLVNPDVGNPYIAVGLSTAEVSAGISYVLKMSAGFANYVE